MSVGSVLVFFGAAILLLTGIGSKYDSPEARRTSVLLSLLVMGLGGLMLILGV